MKTEFLKGEPVPLPPALMWREEQTDLYYLTDNRAIIEFEVQGVVFGIKNSTAYGIGPDRIEDDWPEERGWNVVHAEVLSATETSVTLSYRDIEIYVDAAAGTTTPEVDRFVQ